jgi:hypothetical protein
MGRVRARSRRWSVLVAVLLAIVGLAGPARARADTTKTDNSQRCGVTHCAYALAEATLSCEPEGSDTIVCAADAGIRGAERDSTGYGIVPSLVTWWGLLSCEWSRESLDDDQQGGCGFDVLQQAAQRTVLDGCCTEFGHASSFDVVRVTRPEPFCLWMKVKAETGMETGPIDTGFSLHGRTTAYAGVLIEEVTCTSGATL